MVDEAGGFKKYPVLISKMFCGSYLETGVNIGHEIINFFSVSGSNVGIDDAAESWAYYYIPNNGRVAKEFQEAGTRVLLVGRGKNNPIVYAQAEVCEYLGGGSAPNDACYGGIKIADIFGSNKYKGELEEDSENRITYRVRNVRTPKKQVHLHYVSGDASAEERNRSNYPLLNATPLQDSGSIGKSWYPIFDHEESDGAKAGDEAAFKEMFQRSRVTLEPYGVKEHIREQLTAFMDNDDIWNEPSRLDTYEEAIGSDNSASGAYQGRIWNLLRRSNDELSYSNVLAYLLLEDRHFAECLVSRLWSGEKKCDINAVLKQIRAGKYSVKREWGNMDVALLTENLLLVIENKIDAAITPCKASDRYPGCTTQLDKYWYLCEEKTGCDIYKEAQARVARFYYLLVPDYKEIDQRVKGCTTRGQNFVRLNYSAIRDALIDAIATVPEDEDPVFDQEEVRVVRKEFLCQVNILAEDEDNRTKHEMFARFFDAVNRASGR